MRQLALLALALLLLAGCAAPSERASPPPIPDPDLGEMEPFVASVLKESREAVVREPESAEAWGRLGAAYQAHALLKPAESCYRRAAELAPEEFRWPYFLAVVRGELGADPDELTGLYEAAALLRPDYAPLRIRQGRMLLAHGRYEAARDRFAAAVELAGMSAAAHKGLGQSLLALGRPEEALAPLETAARLDGRDGAVHAALAQLYTRLDDPEAAARASARSKANAPASRIDDPLMMRHVHSMGASARHWFVRAEERVKRGEMRPALEELRMVEQVRPDDADVHYLLGRAHEGLGDRAASRRALAKAVELNPGHAPARISRARIFADEGRGEQALAEIRRAREAAPDDPAVLAALAGALAERGEIAEAVEVTERLFVLMPDNPRVAFNLGSLRARSGDRAGAEQALRRAVALDPDYTAARERLELLTGRAAPERSIADEFRQIAERLYGGRNDYLGRARIDDLKEQLAAGGLAPGQRTELGIQLSMRWLEAGETDAGVAEIERVAREAPDDPLLRTRIERQRALAYLRQAEVQNCVLRHNADCCIFPLEGGGRHTERGPAEQARRSFTALLEGDPDDLRSRWLLNIMSMALGEYPAGVDERWRLPAPDPGAAGIGRFRDIAPGLGVDTFNLCGGAVVEDFDGDDRLDIVTSTFDPSGPLSFYRSDGSGGFEDRSRSSGLAEQLGGLNVVGGDYDNDGDVDLLVLRGAWLKDDGRIRNSLMQNDGNGRFTDVTRRAGLAEPAYPTQVAAWLDYDNDGDLDLYVCNESRKYLPADRADYPSQLYRNDGDGSFLDVAREAGVTNDRYCKGVTAGDYDDDGDMDLYVSNVLENRLYRNNGDGSFSDVAREAGVEEPAERSFASWFFDYDNDGRLDLFVTAYQTTIADLAAETLSLPHEGRSPRLYRNRGDGSFENVTSAVGLDRPFLPMGANFGDVDGDGWLDIYLATGDPSYETLMPNVLLRNEGGKRFVDETRAAGLGHLQKGHGVAFADIDDDGDQDIYHQLGGFYPGDKFHNALFENPGHGNRWLTIELVGSESNRAGVGARIKVVVEGGDGLREIHRAAGSVSSFGGSPSRQEIGLGNAGGIRQVEIYWPASGAHQRLDDVELDRRIVVTEPTGRGSTDPARSGRRR